MSGVSLGRNWLDSQEHSSDFAPPPRPRSRLTLKRKQVDKDDDKENVPAPQPPPLPQQTVNSTDSEEDDEDYSRGAAPPQQGGVRASLAAARHGSQHTFSSDGQVSKTRRVINVMDAKTMKGESKSAVVIPSRGNVRPPALVERVRGASAPAPPAAVHPPPAAKGAKKATKKKAGARLVLDSSPDSSDVEEDERRADDAKDDGVGKAAVSIDDDDDDDDDADASVDEESSSDDDDDDDEEEEEAAATAAMEDEEIAAPAPDSDDEKDDEVVKTQEQLASQRTTNAAAVAKNLPMKIVRRPLMPSLLTVKGAEAVLRRPFKSPCPNAPSSTADLKRKLFMRKRFVPWGSKGLPALPSLSSGSQEKEEEDAGEPLILWQSEEEGKEDDQISVDGMLTKFLRPHQREGVQFMFECVTGLKGFNGNGCILADDMGLGKTLQGITLLYTLLRQGAEPLGGTPIVKRAVIVCPTSLVGNWESECNKWLKGKIKALALGESKREDVIMGVEQFLSRRKPYDVLIVSYETFRMHTDKFKKEGSCDLLMCDEAHRLKNDATLTNQALNSMHCKRRVLLSGTPMQNHLDEFYAMVNFTNPGVLGSAAYFRKHFEGPVLLAREPGATAEEVARGDEISLELSTIVNDFILRRTNSLLSKHLPPKLVEVCCCKLTPMQQAMYEAALKSKAAKALLDKGKGGGKEVLSFITALRKVCNHPLLAGDDAPDDLFYVDNGGRRGKRREAPGWELAGGKFAVLARLLKQVRAKEERIVVVSNYTSTLDLFVKLCREKGYPYVRLDGSLSIKKRMKLVTAFNDPEQDQVSDTCQCRAVMCLHPTDPLIQI